MAQALSDMLQPAADVSLLEILQGVAEVLLRVLGVVALTALIALCSLIEHIAQDISDDGCGETCESEHSVLLCCQGARAGLMPDAPRLGASICRRSERDSVVQITDGRRGICRRFLTCRRRPLALPYEPESCCSWR